MPRSAAEIPRIAANLAGRTLGRPDQPALAEPPVPPAAETAAKGVRRRISKKREGKPDRPWEAPLNPDEFGEVQWPDEMDQTAAAEAAAEETAADEAAAEQEPVNLHSDEEVEMHPRGEPSTIIAEPDSFPGGVCDKHTRTLRTRTEIPSCIC